MKSITTLILPVILVLTSCNANVYKDKSFFSKANLDGQTLAVLPAEVTYTGNLPKNWDDARISRMENEASSRLQQEVYEDFLYHASDRDIRKKYGIKLIDIKLVNDRLEKSGISFKDSWTMPSEEIAKIVGADMVIRARVENIRYMSQAAATGINIGASVIEGLLNKGNNTTVGVPRTRSGETDMDLSLYHHSQSQAIVRFDAEHRLRTSKLPVYVRN
ncbi:hypothetical protein [Daejeonella lutea]|uniref:LPP20 lipoprotein n=1 Tax=Daejeonella lutea TaxID=572036 RepID=A0A1T5E7V2_9SPHI|nr:hypothetical protein [Daejeonella lutea]SKB80077.1 hypothetical protein SAMN05661099_2780 [Daejeonella lutea]